MVDFAAGRIDVLVATTVIEVGVDVPNASVMAVLDADRFGISQLHQLRGRVGRGGHPGLCLLVTDVIGEAPARERLDAVAATTDGFELARLDVQQRREGDVLGSAQSGRRRQLKLLSLLRDEDLITAARAEAADIVAADPDAGRAPAARRAGGRAGQRRPGRVPGKGVTPPSCPLLRPAYAWFGGRTTSGRGREDRRRTGQGTPAGDRRPTPPGPRPTARGRRCSTRWPPCSTSTGLGSSTSSPAPARSGSRRSRAAPPRPCSSSPTARRSTSCAATSMRWGCPAPRSCVGPSPPSSTSPPLAAFDLVFADPPYALADDTLEALLGRLLGGGHLADDAVVVVERSARGAGPTWPAGITPVRDRRYGEGVLWYGRRQ